MINPEFSKGSIFLFLSVIWLILLSSLAFAAEPNPGGTLRIGVRVQQDGDLDARRLTTEGMIPSAQMIYDPLLTWGDKGYASLIPGLATKVETKDNKVWVFHLRKGVKFHNGREMTAQDVKANFDWRIETPKGWKPVKFRELIKDLKKAELVDKYTVRITLDKPFSPFLRILAWAMRGIIPPEEVEKWGEEFNFHPTGTGPFKFAEMKAGDKLVLERFDGYWGPRPYVDRVEYKFYRSDEARLIALQKGEIDMAQLFDEARPILEKDPNLAFREVVQPAMLVKLYFNLRRWPMNDIRFRKAVYMGADWKNIAINAHSFKSGNYARTLLDYTKYFNPGALEVVPPYTPEEAKKLIQAVEKDAGKKIPPIYWLHSSAGINQNLGVMAKAELAQIGVPLNVQLLSQALWFEKILRDPKIEWDICAYGQGFAIDPSLGLTYFETNSETAPDGKSLGGYSNPEFDQWLQKAEVAMKEEDRVKAYQEAEKILLKDAASIPLWAYRNLYAWNKKVKGLGFNDSGNIYVTSTWANTWIEK
jgi:ABC-type transport system substrate-binding protein